ncbi:MAG: hypothetical protein JXQ29_12290 [Planctomycetes bacterium]|nr:hypothetical protein [Planctomycetota bacterium]
MNNVAASVFAAALLVAHVACSGDNRAVGSAGVPIELVFLVGPGGAQDMLEKPCQLRTASGAFVDVGDGGGFAGPTLVDLDEDGDRDLVVGQFNYGYFRVYRNLGTEAKPVYAEPEFLRAADGLASVPMG